MAEQFASGRQADEWMRAAETRLGVGFWSLDLATGKLACSSGLYTLMGINPASVQVDLAFLESLAHPADRLSIDDLDDYATDSRQTHREFRVIRPDGQLRNMLSEACTLHDRDGRAARVVTVVSDVSQRLQVSKRLARNEALLLAIATILGGELWVADETGCLLERFGGLDGKEVRDFEYWREDMHPDDMARLPQLWRDSVDRRRPYIFSPRLRGSDGRYQQVHVKGLPVSVEQSPDRHYGGVATLNAALLAGHGAEQEALVLTPAQVRACRALLDWTAETLAQRSGVSISTIRRIEGTEATGPKGESMNLVMQAFRDAGLSITRSAEGRLVVTDAA